MADALGTPGGVVSDEEFRVDLAGLIAGQSSSIAARTGVMWGPGSSSVITGTSATGTMTVNVGVHHWVSSRAAADGIYLGAKEASSTLNIAAAPGSNSRIDVVYAKQNDAGSTISPDGSTSELYGVVTGTAAASPTKPAIPLGAVEIGTVTVAAGATSTAGAGVTINNTAALTVARGADIPVRNQAERDALTTFPFLTVKRLDTGNIEARNVGNTAWVTIYTPTVAAPPSWTTMPLTANWNTYTETGRYVSNVGYRQEGNRVFLRGYLQCNTTVAAGTAINSTAIPAGLRPSVNTIIYAPIELSTPGRLEIQTSGTFLTYRGVSAPQFFNLDGMSWPLG
jgi:hypothetical protein